MCIVNMVEITFSLIRKSHPDLNADNLEALTSIHLDGLDITAIDGLEIFSHIRELHLCNNKIETIENIEFMTNLKFLDMSNNLISAKSLISGILNLPSQLECINLTGNPCADDEAALLEFQVRIPHLGIIVGLLQEGEDDEHEPVDVVDNNQSSDEDDAETDEDDIESNKLDFGPLDADDLLKSIVERKCQLQSYELASVDSSIMNLNAECEEAISQPYTRRCYRPMTSEDQFLQPRCRFSDASSSTSSAAGDRLSELTELSKSNTSDVHSFMERLRDKSLESRNSAYEKAGKSNF